MAQQTINVGTAPNDGTGTPLRTAFQYTNSNFSELYTAVGPSGNNIVVPGSATITGDLTVDTSTLKVDSANNRVGVLTASPAQALDVASGNLQVRTGGIIYSDSFSNYGAALQINAAGSLPLRLQIGGSNAYEITSANVHTWQNVGGVAGTAMTLNATGLGVGGSPVNKITVTVAPGTSTSDGLRVTDSTRSIISGQTGATYSYLGIGENQNLIYTSGGRLDIVADSQSLFLRTGTNNYLNLDSSGNVGIGVTPSAKLHVSDANLYAPSLTWNTACAAIVRSENGQLATGSDSSGPYAFWMQVRTIGNSARDISLNPLGGNVIIGSRTANNGKLTVTETANSDAVQLIGSSGTFARFYGWSVDNTWNANATAIFVGKQTSTSRSINAGGTVNASGADYAEYMTKGSDFVLSKGGIAGIDANGKLTNVFADAVSFVVKSTDPSYVGNDKWGVGLEGDALETARQLVDRIAFAGQVPVNVTGAKAGDYIVPVVDGTGIKGIAVSNPTFEQYQLAVGKVIAIDADGRARIIVKVA